MTIDTQFKLRSNPLYIEYLHQNSYWYKILNRNPNKINDFVTEVKNTYHLRPTDRIKKALDTVDMLSSILSSVVNK